MGVPQSRWGHLEVLWLNTYVPAKTREGSNDLSIFRVAPSEVVFLGILSPNRRGENARDEHGLHLCVRSGAA